MENIYRGFKVEGTTEKIKKLNQLIEDKKLTREDLTLILKVMEKNKGEKVQIFKAGIYEEYDIEIKGKYSSKNEKIDIPDKCLVILVDIS
jgi:hypothetical protein|nr:MAG TPA: hypothetical protein [Caudoviricetes sp.]